MSFPAKYLSRLDFFLVESRIARNLLVDFLNTSLDSALFQPFFFQVDQFCLDAHLISQNFPLTLFCHEFPYLATSSIYLTFPLLTRFFIMLMLFNIRHQTRLLTSFGKSPQVLFKGFIVPDLDMNHISPNPLSIGLIIHLLFS